MVRLITGWKRMHLFTIGLHTECAYYLEFFLENFKRAGVQ